MLTIVLLPGMDGTGSLFAPFAAALGQEFRVQVMCYPATGELGYVELERHARERLPRDGPFVVLGESFSGPIAVTLAASGPPGLVGIVLCSTFVRNPRPAFGWLRHFIGAFPVKLAPLRVLDVLLLGRFSTPALHSALAAAMSGVSAQALRSRLRAVLSTDVSAKLKAVKVPLLYLLATHDRVVPASSLRHIQDVLSTVRVEPIDAPHFLLQAAPAEAADVVARFMTSLQARNC